MALTCNIDKKGRVARAISGVLTLAVAVPCWVYLDPLLAVLFVLAGLFQLFEAAKGWCVMRAMGFRTRM